MERKFIGFFNRSAIAFIALFIFQSLVFADNLITNGGFEGPDGIEVVPPDWNAGCGYQNTPDSQPGWYNNYLDPYEGKGYINLLYKGDGTKESIWQELRKTLPAGSCFLISIHLAKFCQDSLFGLDPFGLNHAGKLTIRGSEAYSCSEGQVLAVFNNVDNCQWEQFFAIFKTDTEINYIYLEFTPGNSDFPNGSIVIDDMSLEFTKPLPDQDIEVPYGDTVTVKATFSGTNFNWDLDGIFLPDSGPYQTVEVNENMKADVSYISNDSCTIYESFRILVNPVIPNVITPGTRDLVNDEFYIEGLLEKAWLSVYNRWGLLVYSHPNYRNDWIPENLTDGMYFFRLYLYETQREKTGSVYIF